MHRSIEPLSADHDRAGFDCGSEPLNRFLQQVARQHSEKGLSRTFVMVNETAGIPKPVLGYFSLSATEADTEHLPPAIARKLPRKIPAARMGRLAVSKAMQGQGLGSILLIEALRRTAHAADELGICGLFVDAKDDRAAGFYRRFGFESLPEQP